MTKKNKIIERGTCFIAGENGQESSAYNIDSAHKLATVDWEAAYSGGSSVVGDIFEVRFKNTRKGYYQNSSNLILKKGDIVAVEGNPGHDIGIISLTGDLVRKQMRCKRFNPVDLEFKKIFRIARGTDIDKWQEAISLEHQTMIRSRRIAEQLKLNMKIGDVEYQGDRAKAIFYYIADARVDFRELIKLFAEEFKVRIEMKQIGARQEAGRIGGIGSCGRELCCSTWTTNFVSVTTNSARFQDILLNPQKLAGQCGKLKCCLNYEVDTYIDARKGLPKINNPLETRDAQYFLLKTDIFKREMMFSSDPNSMVNTVTIPVERVWDIIHMNRKGIKPEQLRSEGYVEHSKEQPDYKNVVGDDSITRFDKKDGNNGNRRNKRRGDRINKSERADKSDKTEEADNSDKLEKSERTDKPERANRPERSNRGNRGNRGVNKVVDKGEDNTDNKKEMVNVRAENNNKPEVKGVKQVKPNPVEGEPAKLSQNGEQQDPTQRSRNNRRYNKNRQFNRNKKDTPKE